MPSLHPMSTQAPLVSVCIPAYQAGRFIGAAIESVLAQTYPHWELIIVDNASTDDTHGVACSYDDRRISVRRNAVNLGVEANFNLATNAARGDYVKVLCADDLILPECLAAQAEILDAHPNVVVTASRRRFIDANGHVTASDRGIPRTLVGLLDGRTVVRRVVASGRNPLGEPANVLFRRDAYERAGPWSARLVNAADIDLYARMLRFGDFFGDPRTLAAFRVHPASMSTQLAGVSDAQDRQYFRETAADPSWGITRSELWRGLAMSRVNGVARRIRIGRVNRRAVGAAR